MRIIRTGAIFGLAMFLAGGFGGMGTAVAKEINWKAVPTKKLTLFYPGEVNWGWMLDENGHDGAEEVKKGDTCRSCHDGEEAQIGDHLVKAGPMEHKAIKGKPGTKDALVQAAYDANNIYIRVRWDSKEPGKFHNFFRYDGKKWASYGSHRASSKVTSGKTPPNYEDRLAFLIDDGNTPGFKTAGCFLTCHDSMRDQAKMVGKKEVQAHAYLGKGGKNKKDIRKYIPPTRTDGLGWANVKPADQLNAQRKDGVFLDLWQWRAHRSNPVGYADDDWVMEYRWSDKGKLFKNTKLKDGHPVHMFDKSKAGYNGFQYKDRFKVKYYYMTTDMAVPYDAKKYKPRKGDIIPARLIQAKPSGSRADVAAKGTWSKGQWTVSLTRKLDTGDRKTDKAFVPGKQYTVGMAIHDDHVTTRFHYVTFEMVLGFDDPKADINVVKIK